MTATIKGTLKDPLDEEKQNEISKQIVLAEACMLRVMNFDFNFPLPYNYLHLYSYHIYPNTPALYNLSLAVLNDLIGSRAPLLYHARVLAVSALLVAANLNKAPLMSDSKFAKNKNWLSLKTPSLSLNDSEYYKDLSDDKYMELPWFKRIHPDLILEDIESTLLLISRCRKHNKGIVQNLFSQYQTLISILTTSTVTLR